MVDSLISCLHFGVKLAENPLKVVEKVLFIRIALLVLVVLPLALQPLLMDFEAISGLDFGVGKDDVGTEAT